MADKIEMEFSIVQSIFMQINETWDLEKMSYKKNIVVLLLSNFFKNFKIADYIKMASATAVISQPILKCEPMAPYLAQKIIQNGVKRKKTVVTDAILI
jgi:hypothetical protein